MKYSPKNPGRLAGLVMGLWLAGAGHAEFIQPVAVLASNGEDVQDAVINGLGFDDSTVGSPTSVHVRTDGEMWTAVGSTRAEVTFDLGQTVSLTTVYVWNYNGTETDRGMRDVQVLVSAGTDMTTASFTGIATVSLTEGGETAQTFNVVGTDVRLVKLRATSNWGHGWAIGLAEVRFESGEIPGSVPFITINSPREGDEIALGTDILIEATVTDKDGLSNVRQVEFFDGDTLLTNKLTSPFAFLYKGAAVGPHTFRTVVTDKTDKVAWNIVNVSVRELVADRIEKIDDTQDEGTELGQIQYVGAWTLAQGVPSDPRYLNNDHYNSSNNRNDYFEVRFKGVKIDVFATVASHHGTGWASIDGGAESKVNYKTAQRAEQALVWSSPILPNREHVLKIRVGGDGVVTADRFDISVSDKPDVVIASVKEVSATFTNVIVTLEDAGTSVVAPESVQLTLDGAPAAAQAAKVGTITTVTHVPAAPFAPGSTHALLVEAMDTLDTSITNLSTFTLPAPPFPLTGLGEPGGTAGRWSLRQIWDAGRADAVVTAVDIALDATRAGFSGKLQDDQVSAINFALSTSPGVMGLFPGEEPFPAEVAGLAASDFVVVARGKVRIPRSGDWTLGVHSDDGFALRFVGAPFASVSGLGVIDEHFPEYIQVPVPTGDSNTRAVLKNLTAGDYVIELVYFQRTTGAAIEVYAAEGEYLEDADTWVWALIGAADGLELVADELPATPPQITQIRYQAGTVTLDFISSNPAGVHELWESVDLRAWQKITSASFSATGGNGVRATVTGATADRAFYRVAVP